MATGLQLALAAGALVGLGGVLLVWRLTPADPDLADALERLAPQHHRRSVTGTTRSLMAGSEVGAAAVDGANGDISVRRVRPDLRDRLGRWGMTTLPPGSWGATPTKELAILRIPLSRYYGEKLLFALLGMVIPPLLTTFFTMIGAQFPFYVPVGATLAMAAAMFFLPDYNVRDDAKKARAEFGRALGAYIDFVALERNSGAGPRQAMEVAADVGDSWVFRRLAEELARTRWSGLTPWDALHALADELGLPELDDLADIMRLSGEEGAQIYKSLRARSASMRNVMLTTEKAKANEIGERMSIPMSLLGVIFLAMLVAPALLRVLGGTT